MPNVVTTNKSRPSYASPFLPSAHLPASARAVPRRPRARSTALLGGGGGLCCTPGPPLSPPSPGRGTRSPTVGGGDGRFQSREGATRSCDGGGGGCSAAGGCGTRPRSGNPRLLWSGRRASRCPARGHRVGPGRDSERLLERPAARSVRARRGSEPLRAALPRVGREPRVGLLLPGPARSSPCGGRGCVRRGLLGFGKGGARRGQRPRGEWA